MKQYVITVRFDLKTTSVYGPFDSVQKAEDFLDDKIDAGEVVFNDTDFVDIQEIMSPETVLEDFKPEEQQEEELAEEHNYEMYEYDDEGDNEEEFFASAYQAPELSSEEKKYHAALFRYSGYLTVYQPQKIYAALAEGKDPDQYIDELFWADPEKAIQEMVDSEFPLVNSRNQVVAE